MTKKHGTTLKGMVIKMNKEFFEAVQMLEKEKGIPAEYLYEKIQNAIIVALRKDYNGKDVVSCEIDPENYEMNVFVRKNVVDEIDDEDTDITVADAQQYKPGAEAGDIIEIMLDTKDFGRIAAQTAKHVIRQGIRDAEKGQIMMEFQSKQQELVTAKVLSVDPITGNATLEIGKAEAILPKGEQVPGEELTVGELIKVFIVDVRDTEKGPKAMISRTHQGLVKRLFETEVPEIYDGTVTINAISREAGARTKMAVSSKDENVDAIGACIGPRGSRVNKIVELLGGEKIDIVNYSEDPKQFVAAALAPANVLSVEIPDSEVKSCVVTVPDNQLSLAIGNKGQNARLAARLTGWKIDIMKQKKIPLRKCLGCGCQKPKQELVRVVRSSEGEVSLDLTGKKAGRGAYICKSAQCLKAARKAKRIDRAFSVTVPDDVYDEMEKELSENE